MLCHRVPGLASKVVTALGPRMQQGPGTLSNPMVASTSRQIHTERLLHDGSGADTGVR